jgi:hypothetical protein
VNDYYQEILCQEEKGLFQHNLASSLFLIVQICSIMNSFSQKFCGIGNSTMLKRPLGADCTQAGRLPELGSGRDSDEKRSDHNKPDHAEYQDDDQDVFCEDLACDVVASHDRC